MKELYLDANAHVRLSKKAQEAYCNYNDSLAGAGHPLAPALPGREASTAIETARGRIAALLGAPSSSHIVFTSTCTQACEWALNITQKVAASRNQPVTYSPMEHAAIRTPIESDLFKKNNVRKFSVFSSGVIDTVVTSQIAVCIHVQNEIGTIQPIENINADFLLSDMCQSPGKVSICLKDMPVDIAVFGAHKFGGPASVGFMYLKELSNWSEFGTGSRYFNDRPGTPDGASIVATAAALEETLTEMPERLANMKEFQDTLEDRLEDMGLTVIGKDANRVPNTTFVKIKDMAFDVLVELNSRGIYVGMGSACGSMHSGKSLIMDALGLEGEGHDFLRISQHGEYGKEEALYVADEIFKILNK